MALRIPASIQAKIKGLTKKDAEKEFNNIKQAIDDIYESRASNMNYRVLYDTVWRLVTNKYGEMVYIGVQKAVKHHTKGICVDVSKQPDPTFLSYLLQTWEKFRKSASIIRDLLLYLDESYVEKKSTHEKKVLGVYDVVINIFKNEVLMKLTNRLQRLMLEIIQKERDGEEVADRFLLKNLTLMMTEIDKDNVYIPVFEVKFLQESHTYYAKESQRYFDSSTAPAYLNKVKIRLKEESERAERCLDPDTKGKIEKVVREEMIEKYKELVIKKENSGVLVMLKDERHEELRLVYEVLGLVDGALKPTIDLLKEYVTEVGLAIVKDKDKDNNPLELVNDVIALRVKYDDLLLESFSQTIKGVKVRDKDFSQAIKEAFDNIVNTNPRFPEYLSLLLDKKLKKGKNQIEEKEQDAFFDKVILVFRHVREKDVFEKYYKNHLAKRLLTNRSASDDAERFFISKLKAEFGYQFTSKLEGMFKDMKISEQLDKEWHEHVNNLTTKPSTELSVTVLTHGCWPVTSTARLELPQYINASLDMFKDFYLKNHSGRKLTWQFNMGTADLKANGYPKKYELNVSTYQLGILLRFNESKELTFGELMEKTKIPVPDLKRNLLALCLAADRQTKTSKLLLRNPPKKEKKEIDNNTKFTPNEGFKSKLLKVKILPVVMKESDKARQKTTDKINEERKWVLDAVIVRIMKMRKKLEHKQLIEEVVQQLANRFVPNAELIKKRIESLIDREYLERNEHDRKIYHYLA